METEPPALVAHADWSVRAKKRWLAVAARLDDGEGEQPARFLASEPEPAGEPGSLLSRLRSTAGESAGILLGFDFPIGLPLHYARLAGVNSFLELLPGLGHGAWADFYTPAFLPDEIGPDRPFYPSLPGQASYAHLLQALQADSMQALMRRCELATPERRAASPLFWTLGGQQVGKAAISGWREVLGPALRDRLSEHGFSIWPFSGRLAQLLRPGALVVAECYPGEYYRHLGVSFSPARRAMRSGKRVQADRAANAHALVDWAVNAGVALSAGLRSAILDGFGAAPDGEDRFDAVIGLFGMLNVLLGRRPAGEPQEEPVRQIEGWILGQAWPAGR